MLQCVAVCCSVLQSIAMFYDSVCGVPLFTASVGRRVSARQVVYMTACCSVLQCVAVCCSVLHCVAVYCSLLQFVAVSLSCAAAFFFESSV